MNLNITIANLVFVIVFYSIIFICVKIYNYFHNTKYTYMISFTTYDRNIFNKLKWIFVKNLRYNHKKQRFEGYVFDKFCNSFRWIEIRNMSKEQKINLGEIDVQRYENILFQNISAVNDYILRETEYKNYLITKKNKRVKNKYIEELKITDFIKKGC